jgi:hypothetical protein
MSLSFPTSVEGGNEHVIVVANHVFEALERGLPTCEAYIWCCNDTPSNSVRCAHHKQAAIGVVLSSGDGNKALLRQGQCRGGLYQIWEKVRSF